MKNNKIFLLWCWQLSGFTISGMSSKTLKGAYTNEEEATYYCDRLNNKYKDKDIKFYVEPFYCDTTFYFMDANGNEIVPKYKKKK